MGAWRNGVSAKRRRYLLGTARRSAERRYSGMEYSSSGNLNIGTFSLGVGDRFGLQAEAQLRACLLAAARGTALTPVWNKSNREHLLIGSDPMQVRTAAQAAVKQLGWKEPWHVDADHIRLDTVDRFISTSDFFTIDVADAIGKSCEPQTAARFADRHAELTAPVQLPGMEVKSSRGAAEEAAQKYLAAARHAGKVYRYVERAKGRGKFIVEVSLDETDQPQTPLELLVILAALADEGVPVQTIAPRFSGQFHKGVDYLGDLAVFEREFSADLHLIGFAVATYGLPPNLKLSVHSGSDKFSLYPIIRRALEETGAGLHLKTAGTTWLEELLGLAETGGEGLAFAKKVYEAALDRVDELCAPYAAVIGIERARLPSGAAVTQWTSEQFVRTLRHDASCHEFNPHLRQLLHVAFRIAAEERVRYLDLVREHRSIIDRNVTANLFERHIRPLFPARERP